MTYRKTGCRFFSYLSKARCKHFLNATVFLPATFFAGISFPVREMYAKPEFRRCFCSFFRERVIFLSMPVSAADIVAILEPWRSLTARAWSEIADYVSVVSIITARCPSQIVTPTSKRHTGNQSYIDAFKIKQTQTKLIKQPLFIAVNY